MAKIGLKKIYFGVLASDTAEGCLYESMEEMTAPIESKLSLNLVEGKLYAGDQVKESAEEFSSGTLTLGVADDDDAICAKILGTTSSKITIGEKSYDDYVQKSTDVSPYLGFGQIVPKVVDGKRRFKAEFLCKTKFKPFNKEAKTKGSSLEYTTPSLEATVYETVNNEYEHHSTFDTEAEAIAYITALFKLKTQQGAGNSGS